MESLATKDQGWIQVQVESLGVLKDRLKQLSDEQSTSQIEYPARNAVEMFNVDLEVR